MVNPESGSREPEAQTEQPNPDVLTPAENNPAETAAETAVSSDTAVNPAEAAPEAESDEHKKAREKVEALIQGKITEGRAMSREDYINRKIGEKKSEKNRALLKKEWDGFTKLSKEEQEAFAVEKGHFIRNENEFNNVIVELAKQKRVVGDSFYALLDAGFDPCGIYEKSVWKWTKIVVPSAKGENLEIPEGEFEEWIKKITEDYQKKVAGEIDEQKLGDNYDRERQMLTERWTERELAGTLTKEKATLPLLPEKKEKKELTDKERLARLNNLHVAWEEAKMVDLAIKKGKKVKMRDGKVLDASEPGQKKELTDIRDQISSEIIRIANAVSGEKLMAKTADATGHELKKEDDAREEFRRQLKEEVMDIYKKEALALEKKTWKILKIKKAKKTGKGKEQDIALPAPPDDFDFNPFGFNPIESGEDSALPAEPYRPPLPRVEKNLAAGNEAPEQAEKEEPETVEQKYKKLLKDVRGGYPGANLEEVQFYRRIKTRADELKKEKKLKWDEAIERAVAELEVDENGNLKHPSFWAQK